MAKQNTPMLTRREILASFGLATAAGSIRPVAGGTFLKGAESSQAITGEKSLLRAYGEYSGERLSRVAFPMGGMGAGMIALSAPNPLWLAGESDSTLSLIAAAYQSAGRGENCTILKKNDGGAESAAVEWLLNTTQ